MKQPNKTTYPPDLTVVTKMIFVNTNILEHQHVVGVKFPFLRIMENPKQFKEGNFQTLQQQPKKFSLTYSSRSSLLVQLKNFKMC